MIPLITLEGPTASGKTELAILLAKELGSEIISADSRQVYRYLDIGTAKPSVEQLQQVKHHLISIIDPSESYNAGRFCADAGNIIEDLNSRGIIPIVCGGTGLYVSSLLTGLFPEIKMDKDIRANLIKRMNQEGLASLFEELKKIDPDFAFRISSNDKQRILRGLEVYYATGIPITKHWKNQTSHNRYHTFRILLQPPREILYPRINNRIQQMIDSGLLNEIEHLFKLGYTPLSPGSNTLGYKEFLPYFLESAPLNQCISLAAQHTRNYAKRQYTWYRKYKF
ncbi:MAG TPA: tRNA (adenosine(37)-N6)-dimethylallyltransferase MiaA, partial [Candidatus Syntrophosphaera thermopropionivorans]|nr:tRNA (adenosine(37)-N6)-dimethylallyltransferase MiaA [Candidatus Syntrophosphaera thermopropionivorans]